MEEVIPGKICERVKFKLVKRSPEHRLDIENKCPISVVVDLRAPFLESYAGKRIRSWLLTALVVAFSATAWAQTPTGARDVPSDPKSQEQTSPFPLPPVDLKSLPRNLFMDQKHFWTAPLHMSQTQWEWAPAALLVGGLFIKADQSIENHVPTSKSTVSHAVTASNAGVGVLAATGAGLFLLGHMHNDDQKRETGILAGEAAIGALADTEVFKYAAGRERPFTGTSPGRFFVGGDSFPSVHSSVSWAIASVIAHEYPGPLTQLLAYGAAGGVSAARWAGQKHFFSDVAIGAALGWYMGRASLSQPLSLQRRRCGTLRHFLQIRRKRRGPDLFIRLELWAPVMFRSTVGCTRPSNVWLPVGYIQSESLSIRPVDAPGMCAPAAARPPDHDAVTMLRQKFSSSTTHVIERVRIRI